MKQKKLVISSDLVIEEVIENARAMGGEAKWVEDLEVSLQDKKIANRLVSFLADAGAIAIKNVIISGNKNGLDKKDVQDKILREAEALRCMLTFMTEAEARAVVLSMGLCEDQDWVVDAQKDVISNLRGWTPGKTEEVLERNRRIFHEFKTDVWRKFGSAAA